jgi:hypothetical protein
MEPLIDWLMTTSPEVAPIDSLEIWWQRHLAMSQRFGEPIDLAIAAGFAADRLGYAFSSGYQAAGTAMFGSDPRGPRPAALCATERGSAHPRNIETTLTHEVDGWRLSGEKSFVTLGTFATRLLIVATEGKGDDGRNRLRVASIDVRDGVAIQPLPRAPFVPEIPHASVTLDAVRVADEEVFDGDGYTRFLKPFRTVEDVHVHGALLGWLIQVSRRNWPPQITEQLLACSITIRALAAVSPSSSAGHIGLAGAMGRVRALLEEIEPRWSEVDVELRSRWERDRALLKVAGKARAKRRETAWRALGSEVDLT